jgi:cation:H+ antiporter
VSLPALTDVALILVSIGLLWKGADWVVGSACSVAYRFKLPEAVIGATLVALGTSAPEVVVTLVAALRGEPDISVGNVVGSNIFNLGIILGGCATIWAIPTTRQLVQRDTPALLFAALLLLLFLSDGTLGRWEGLGMVVILCGYVLYLVNRGGLPLEEPEIIVIEDATRRDFFLLILGLASVISGAHLLVRAASSLAIGLGLSTWAIGVTVVAAGTSLPELATAFVAVHRGRTALMAGTLVGSDLFNVLGVLGLAAFLHPLNIVPGARVSLMMMAGMVAVLLIFLRSGWRLSRSEGLLLILFALVRWSRDLTASLEG